MSKIPKNFLAKYMILSIFVNLFPIFFSGKMLICHNLYKKKLLDYHNLAPYRTIYEVSTPLKLPKMQRLLCICLILNPVLFQVSTLSRDPNKP